jgi:hypothetical protein
MSHRSFQEESEDVYGFKHESKLSAGEQERKESTRLQSMVKK